jgi:peptidoglycan/LPS O-acetylase OafA/YrhL
MEIVRDGELVSTNSYLPGLDSLRGLAVLAVMLVHVGKRTPDLPLLQHGAIGVDLFFVLSGFLITRTLLRSRSSPRYFSSFYAGRILRIWPLYFTVLFIAFVAIPWLRPEMAATIFDRAYPWWSYPMFLNNLLVNAEGFGPVHIAWSLAIEEQFYLLWPIVIAGCDRRTLRRLIPILFVAGLGLRLFCAGGLLHISMYYNTLTRMDGLLVGSFLAVTLSDVKLFADVSLARHIGVLAAIIVPIALMRADLEWIRYSILSVAFGCAVVLSIHSKLLESSTFLRFTGRISYGLYMLHLLCFGVIDQTSLRFVLSATSSKVANEVSYVLLSFLFTYGAASLSWFVMERPILRVRHFRHLPANGYPGSVVALPGTDSGVVNH